MLGATFARTPSLNSMNSQPDFHAAHADMQFHAWGQPFNWRSVPQGAAR